MIEVLDLISSLGANLMPKRVFLYYREIYTLLQVVNYDHVAKSNDRMVN